MPIQDIKTGLSRNWCKPPRCHWVPSNSNSAISSVVAWYTFFKSPTTSLQNCNSTRGKTALTAVSIPGNLSVQTMSMSFIPLVFNSLKIFSQNLEFSTSPIHIYVYYYVCCPGFFQVSILPFCSLLYYPIRYIAYRLRRKIVSIYLYYVVLYIPGG